MKIIIKNSFEKDIIGMMAEYNITMFDALLWDFEAFTLEDVEEFYVKNGATMVENRFRYYLMCSQVPKIRRDFYTDIFMGRSENMELKYNDDTKKQ